MTRCTSFASTCLAVLLAVALIPFAPLTAFAERHDRAGSSAQESAWPHNIDELLKAGPYVEGEVLVLLAEPVAEEAASEGARGGDRRTFSLRSSKDLLASAESLVTISSETVEQVVPEYSTVADAEASRARNARLLAVNEEMPDYVATLVCDRNLSTRELLEILADDERVIMAQPNYCYEIEEPVIETEVDLTAAGVADMDGAADAAGIVDATGAADAGDASAAADAADAAETAYLTEDDIAEPNVASSAGDLTSLQWAYDNRAKIKDGTGTMVVPDTSSLPDDFDVNPPSWNDESEENAGFVVAVADTGVDYTHPDLAGVMLGNMEQYNPDGGFYGYNAVYYDDETACKDPMDENGHGTHVAGIIASEWNGMGTSGVANGVKLVAVAIADDEGVVTEARFARSYDYLSKAIDAGLNLVAVNNSWGSSRVSGFFDLFVTELGNKGAVSVFTAGNDNRNIDTTPRSVGAMIDNPYLVSVGASDSTGEMAWFSNYGKAATDLFAPGDSILSTVMQCDATYYSIADKDPLFFHSFDGEELSDFKAYNFSTGESIPVYQTVNQGALPEGVDESLAYDATGGVVAVRAKDALRVDENGIIDDDRCELLVDMTVSAESEAALHEKMKRAAFAQLASTVSANGCVFVAYTRTFTESEGEAWTGVSFGFLSDAAWALSTFDFRDILSLFDKDALCYEVSQVDGEWQATLSLRFTIMPSGGGKISDDLFFCFDAIGIGNNVVPYDFMDGTSMAAPVVTGAAAVLAAKHQPDTLASARTAEDAAELAALVKGSVRPVEAFEGLCTSGGHLDLSVERDGFTPAPSAVRLAEDAEGYLLEVSGWWFGEEKGSVAIDGASADVVSWSDSFITLRVPEEQEAAVVSVSVTAQNGKTGLVSYCLDLPVEEGDDALPLFEKKIDLGAMEGLTYSAEGLLAGLGGDVYMLATNGFEEYRSLYCYDPAEDELSRRASMPFSLHYASVTTYDGKLFVLGCKSDMFSSDEAASEEMALFCYDAVSDRWEEIPLPENTPAFSSIVNFDGALLLLGGDDSRLEEESEKYRGICVLDLDAGEAKLVGLMAKQRIWGVVSAVHGETLFVAGGFNAEGEWNSCLEVFTWNDGALNGADVSDRLPCQADIDEYTDRYALAAVAESVLAVGYNGIDDEGVLLANDTFYLGLPEDEACEPFGKRPLRETIFNPSALAYDGWLYALGGSYYQDNRLVLVATPIETLPLAGDVVEPEDPSGPVNPEDPEGPDNPSGPGGTGGQEDPSNPDNPNNPVSPGGSVDGESAPVLADMGDTVPVAPLMLTAALAAMVMMFAVRKLCRMIPVRP